MALATILKSHKPVNPVFVPVESPTAPATHQEVDTADADDEVEVEVDKPRSEGKKHREISDKTKRRKGERELTEKKLTVDPEKDKRTVFVGNLPPTCTKKQLVKEFCRYGKIESVRFRCARGSKILPKRTIAKQGWGNAEQGNEMIAYIVFEREDDMVKSLETNGTLLDDRHVRVDSVGGASQHKHSHSVFVGNLPFTITNERLREALQQCGEIEGTRVVRDKKTGCGKGFGFVLFKEKSGVMFALKQAKSIEIDGRKLRIFKSSEDPKKQTSRTKKKKFQKGRPGTSNSKKHKPGKQKKGIIHKKKQ